MKLHYGNLLAVSMTRNEIIGLVVAILGLLIFSVVFTLVYFFMNKRDAKDFKEGKRDIELIDDDLRSSEPKYQKRRKILSVTSNVLFYLLIVLCVPIIIFSIVSRVQGDYFMIGNKGIIAVGSGSMSFKDYSNAPYLSDSSLGLNNQFNQYDVLVIEKVNEASDLKLYDVIVFVNDKGETIIHRIIKIDEETGKYTTRGDANGDTDKYRPNFDDVLAKYTDKRVGKIGIIIMFLNSFIGLVTIFTLVYILFMIDFFRRKSNLSRNERLGLLSVIFNPEKNKTILDGNIYYQDCKYVYRDNKFVAKESIELGSLKKRARTQPVYEKNGNYTDIEIEFFDPIYQDSDIEIDTNEKIENNEGLE